MDEATRCERRDKDGRRCVLVGPCPHSENLCMFSVPMDSKRCGSDRYGRCLRAKHANDIHWYEFQGYRYATPAELAEDAKPDAGPTQWCPLCGANSRGEEDDCCERCGADLVTTAVLAAILASRDAEVAALTERLAVQAGHVEELRAEIARLTSAGAEPTPEDAAALKCFGVGGDGSVVVVGNPIGGDVFACRTVYWFAPSRAPVAYARTAAGWRRLGLPQPVEAPKPATLTEADVEFVRALEMSYVANAVGNLRSNTERAAERAVEAREASRG